jgi:alkyl sulfatase BDS1-like metallo-beta-lactamase superfamily hydrolase
MAENATRHLHNFIPLRGSVARNPRMWSHYLSQAIELFGAKSEVLIGQHREWHHLNSTPCIGPSLSTLVRLSPT